MRVRNKDKALKRATDFAFKTFRYRQLTPFEEGMNNRIQKECHVRMKPKVLTSVTGGFDLSQHKKKRPK